MCTRQLERRLDLCDQHSQLLARPRAVALAVFFTHLHYDPHCHGIAEESTLSTLAEFAADSQLPAEEVAEVRRLIEAAVANSTPAHLSRDAYGTEDGHFFLDINTAVLGADAGDYGDYAARMRDEYGFMSDADYAQLRLKVLRCFLQIPNIFATREFRQRYEGQARENIGREIASLL